MTTTTPRPIQIHSSSTGYRDFMLGDHPHVQEDVNHILLETVRMLEREYPDKYAVTSFRSTFKRSPFDERMEVLHKVAMTVHRTRERHHTKGSRYDTFKAVATVDWRDRRVTVERLPNPQRSTP